MSTNLLKSFELHLPTLLAVVLLFVIVPSSGVIAGDKSIKKQKPKNAVDKTIDSTKADVDTEKQITEKDKKMVFALWKKLKTAIVKQDKKSYVNLFFYEDDGKNYSLADWWPTTKQEYIIGFDSFFSSMYRNKLKSNKETEEEFIFKNGKEKKAELWLQLSYDLRKYSFKKYGDGKWYVFQIQKIED